MAWKCTDSCLCQLIRSCGVLAPTRPRQQAQEVQGNDGRDGKADSAEQVTRVYWSPSVGPPDLQLKNIYTNACSLDSKQEELEAIVQKKTYDVVPITETWWDESHNCSVRRDSKAEGMVVWYSMLWSVLIVLKLMMMMMKMKMTMFSALVKTREVFNNKTSCPQNIQPPEVDIRNGELEEAFVMEEEIASELLCHLDTEKIYGP
ncbi:hypothetical protein DUI87_03998 [Hirundo rustica rustica]|uniref:Uncharacterized protein n=1 Tax=Hirundo rustica rustica TaxID=333673 RepID=A0A3M0L1Q3_HIRRU|nr:hypothetical protein DUI87_03998 [Hirundo rustica rustica]